MAGKEEGRRKREERVGDRDQVKPETFFFWGVGFDKGVLVDFTGRRIEKSIERSVFFTRLRGVQGVQGVDLRIARVSLSRVLGPEAGEHE